MEKRFQECSKLVKIWRYRWYLLIPFKWSSMMIKRYIRILKEGKDEDDLYFTGRVLWGIIVGEMQINMKWYYTSEEVFEKINKKFDKNLD